MPDNRWTRQGTRHSYTTSTHKYKPVRTPGGKLVSQRMYKKCTIPKCMDCKMPLPGIKSRKLSEIHRSKKRERTVARAYGGAACHSCLKQRIVRAFLLEEQKAVKKVLAERAGKK